MLREVAYDPRRLEQYIDQIDQINPDRLKQYEEATGIALARANVDFGSFRARNLENEERRLMPRFVESYFVAAAREIGLRVEPRADGLWRVEHVLADLRSDRLAAVRKLGKAEAAYRKLTFHKHHLDQNAHVDASLIGPGHPLYAAVDEKLNEKLSALTGGTAVYVDPLASAPYRLHFCEIAIRGKNTKGEDQPLFGELVAVREEGGEFEKVPGDWLLNLPPHPSPPATIEPTDPAPAADFLKSRYQLECRAQCQREREHFATVCRDYLTRSFKARIDKAQERAMSLGARAGASPEFKLAFDEACKAVADLERDRADRLAGLDRLGLARTGPVKHVGTAVVLTPDEDVERQLGAFGIETDDELRRRKERAAEEITIASLVADGFPRANIERVANQRGLGFDIRAHRVMDRATGAIEVRRVEVKGYTRGTPIQLEVTEWNQAYQLRETYWLYVVWDPLTPGAEPVRIQDPATRLEYAAKEVVKKRVIVIPVQAIDGAGWTGA